MIRVATIFAAFAVAVMAMPASASAQETASCTILEIEANNSGSGIDKALKPLSKKLKRPPMSSWNSFKLLKRHNAKAVKMTAANVKLATQGKLAILYRDLISTPNKKPRLRLTFTLLSKANKRQANTTLTVDAGDFTLVGGQKLPGGGDYLAAVSCRAK